MKRQFIIRQALGKSMMPTIKPGKLLVASKNTEVNIGDVVILNFDDHEIVKRVKYTKGSKIYVLGDNSEYSTDSRTFGWLNKNQIKGKIIWPLLS